MFSHMIINKEKGNTDVHEIVYGER